MLSRRAVNVGLLAGALAATQGLAGPVLGTEAPRPLPTPNTDGGVSLRAALAKRQSIRSFSERPLPAELLSDLLWAAYGVNRPATGDRTAPSWRHIIVIEIYVAMADGVWRYDPVPHALVPHLARDLRADTGMQAYVDKAPVNLVYVAHGERMGGIPEADQRLWASVDTGFIGQNVYLLAAAEGLAAVFRASVERERLAKTLGLGAGQFITAAQTIGYPIG